jgi:hypothetical protein
LALSLCSDSAHHKPKSCGDFLKSCAGRPAAHGDLHPTSGSLSW